MSSGFDKKLDEMADVYLRKRTSVVDDTKELSFLEMVKEAGGLGRFVDRLQQGYKSGGVLGALSPSNITGSKGRNSGIPNKDIQQQMDPQLVQVYSNQWLRMNDQQKAYFNNDVNNYINYRLTTNTNSNPQQVPQPPQPPQPANPPQPAQPQQPVQPAGGNSVVT